MAYFLSITLWLLVFGCVNYLRKIPFSNWGGMQWFFLVFTVVMLVTSVFTLKLGIEMSKEHKEKLKQDEENQKKRAKMHYDMTYEGIDIIPDGEMDSNTDDYNVYMNAAEGEVIVGDDGETLRIVESESEKEK